MVVGYCCCWCSACAARSAAGCTSNFGIQLAFTSTGAALATAVMSFPLVVRSIRMSLESARPRTRGCGAHARRRPVDRFFSITLPLIAPGILAGAVTAFAAGLGEFGAVITFVSNIPGETRTLPLALYTALQTPDGDSLAARLAHHLVLARTRGPAGRRILARRVRRHRWGRLRCMFRIAASQAPRRLHARRGFRRSHPGVTALFGRSGCGKSTLIS